MLFGIGVEGVVGGWWGGGGGGAGGWGGAMREMGLYANLYSILSSAQLIREEHKPGENIRIKYRGSDQ